MCPTKLPNCSELNDYIGVENGEEPEIRAATSSTAAALLEAQQYEACSTGFKGIDDLIYKTWIRASEENGIRRTTPARRGTGSVVPGMTLEICGPPGGGKTALATSIVISALTASATPRHQAVSQREVLIVGELSPTRFPGVGAHGGPDTEGGHSPERLLEALTKSEREDQGVSRFFNRFRRI